MRLKLFRNTNNDNVSSLVEDDKYHNTTTSFYHEQNRALTEPRRHIKSPFTTASSTPFSSTSAGRKQQRRRRLSLVMNMFEESSNNVKLADERLVNHRAQADDKDDNEISQSAASWSSYSNKKMAQSNIEEYHSWSSLVSETESQSSTSSSSVYEGAKEVSTLSSTAFVPLSQHHATALSPPPRPSVSNGREKHNIASSAQHDACEYLTAMSTSSNSNKMSILMEENRRLREANASILQMQHEDQLNSSKSLAAAYREIKYLRRVISCTNAMASTARPTTQVRRRRHSTDCMDNTGETFSVKTQKQGISALVRASSTHNSITSSSSSVNLSYERKLKILLDEIEAMQAEDDQLQAQRIELEQKNIQLKFSLENSQETIRQLQHELRLART